MVYCRSWKRWSWPCWRSDQDCYQTCHFKLFFLWKLLWHGPIPFWEIFKQFALSPSRGWCQNTWRGKGWRFPEGLRYCWWLLNVPSSYLYTKQWNLQGSSLSLSVWQLSIQVLFLQNVSDIPASLHPTETQLPTVPVSYWVNRRHRGHQHWSDHSWTVLCNRCIFNNSWHSLICENYWGMCCSWLWLWRWFWPQNFPRAGICCRELFGKNKIN